MDRPAASDEMRRAVDLMLSTEGPLQTVQAAQQSGRTERGGMVTPAYRPGGAPSGAAGASAPGVQRSREMPPPVRGTRTEKVKKTMGTLFGRLARAVRRTPVDGVPTCLLYTSDAADE